MRMANPSTSDLSNGGESMSLWMSAAVNRPSAFVSVHVELVGCGIRRDISCQAWEIVIMFNVARVFGKADIELLSLCAYTDVWMKRFSISGPMSDKKLSG